MREYFSQSKKYNASHTPSRQEARQKKSLAFSFVDFQPPLRCLRLFWIFVVFIFYVCAIMKESYSIV